MKVIEGECLKFSISLSTQSGDKEFSVTYMKLPDYIPDGNPVDISIDDTMILRKCIVTRMDVDKKCYQFDLPGYMATDSRTFMTPEGIEVTISGTFEYCDKKIQIKFKDGKKEVWLSEVEKIRDSFTKPLSQITFEEYQSQLLVERL